MFGLGHVLAIIGAGLCVALPGLGSALAVSKAGQTVAGVTAEQPKAFRNAFLLHVFPATNGLYGFVGGIMIIQKIWVGGAPADVTTQYGWGLLLASLPLAIVGFLSALYQSSVARASIQLVAKRPGSFVSGLMITGIVEMYCILAMVVTILLIG